MKEDTKEKISKSLKGRQLSEKTKQKMSEAQKGKKKPEGFNVGREITWGDKISESLKGKKKSKESVQKMSEAQKGKTAHNKGISWGKHTEEAKQKIGEASRKRPSPNKDKKLSEKTKKKMSESRKGRRMSKEAKEKIRKANLGKERPEMVGKNNPMFTHPDARKSKYGKVGFREDLGFVVRSSWEADMSRIFNYLGFDFQYEPCSFALSDGTTYTPDFYLHDTEELIEVKGYWIKGARKKFRQFRKDYPNLNIEIIGKKKFSNYISQFKNKLTYLENSA